MDLEKINVYFVDEHKVEFISLDLFTYGGLFRWFNVFTPTRFVPPWPKTFDFGLDMVEMNQHASY